jgi:hypothetical protein
VQKQRSYYLDLRRKFEPSSVKLVIVAESPPSSGNYFYDPSGKVSEHLFSALMKQLGIEPNTKSEGLREFQKRGWVLVDATYEQVNKYDDHGRDLVIDRDHDKLVSDLKQLLASGWREIRLVLIKKNVCKLLDPKLKDGGFNVLNKGRIVVFPFPGRNQRDFDRQFRKIVHGEGLTAEPKAPVMPEGKHPRTEAVSERMITAEEMAKEAGVNPKVFRAALRKEKFRWHIHNAPWCVREGSSEHRDMLRVLNGLNKR